jgi:hypothetical protein
MRLICLLVLLFFTGTSSAWAQTARAGITASVDKEVRRVVAAEAMQVTERENDSLLNGALIGAGVGIASGLALCRMTEPWENCRDDVGPMLRIGAIGAGIGIAIDALIRGPKIVDNPASGATQLHAAPIAGRREGGLQVSLSF